MATVTFDHAPRLSPGGTRAAVDSLSLDIADGEFLVLVGPSGCGKSTLLSLIAGLTAPTTGRVQWWGGDFANTGGAGRKIAFVFQSPTLMPWARVTTNVRLPLDLAGVPRSAADNAVKKALARVHLTRFGDHLPRQLSGGMQMRASIARALVTEPDLLLMDEPFGALDEFTRNRLDGDLQQLWKARGFTVVFVTHSIYEAVFLSSRVIVLAARPGRVIADVPIDGPAAGDAGFRVSAPFIEYCRVLSEHLGRANRGER
jgi:NitT/TauT family transport system ATP-binding protein